MFNFKKLYNIVVDEKDITKLIECANILDIKIDRIGSCGWADHRPWFIIFRGTKKEHETLLKMMSLIDIHEIEQ